ncbi:4910_t:CDS:2 [Cetraspora pellucida]|uniref:4910_t:CDS:1 n=1 Tax=Cetraspora pellucida TaxID=1433469 RepID=A0A9N9NSH7_9GLOM|nr:4910_t:CDS:2 [Cetraspora pellucida]
MFGYYRMIKTGNPSYPKKNLCTKVTEAWKLVKKKKKNEIDDKIREYLTTSIPIQSYVSQPFYKTVSKNAAVQKKLLAIKKENAKKLVELKAIYEATKETKKISILKHNAAYQAKSNAKKLKRLYENQEVVVYNSPGRPPLLFNYSDLYEHIHNCIEKKYNKYLSRTTLNNYLLLRNSSSIATRVHHHPALVAITNVSRSEKKEHTDEYYCLASVKDVRQFAAMFLYYSVVISQDDKAKVLFEIPAVGKTF